MKHTANTGRRGLDDQGTGVVLGLARVHHDRAPGGRRQLQLIAEAVALPRSRTVIIVVVEPTLSDGDRAALESCPNPGAVSGGVILTCVVRVHSRGGEDES